ncbi:MAG: ankyrin repeat domain-containing protein, partial [Cellulomonas sp.]|nr:ankyrin repeat domain-containing protein [Rickettsiella sp.]
MPVATSKKYVSVLTTTFQQRYQLLSNFIEKNKFETDYNKLENNFKNENKGKNLFILNGNANESSSIANRKSFLHKAAAERNLPLVRFLIATGHDIDLADTQQRTPLYDACEKLELTTINALLDAGADPNKGNNQLFDKASIRNEIQSKYEYEEERSSIPEDEIAPLFAVIKSNTRITPETLTEIITPQPSENFFSFTTEQATEYLEATITKKLLEKGADVNLQTGKYYFSPLIRAIRDKKISIIKEIINSGKADFSLLDHDGETIAHLLSDSRTKEQIESGQTDIQKEMEIAELVIPHLTALNIQESTDLNTPLTAAVIWANKKLVKFFLENDYKYAHLKLLSMQNRKGNTPIHEAIRVVRKDPEILDLLLGIATKADLAITNNDGQTAEQLAEDLIAEAKAGNDLIAEVNSAIDDLAWLIGDSEESLNDAAHQMHQNSMPIDAKAEVEALTEALENLRDSDTLGNILLDSRPDLDEELVDDLYNQLASFLRKIKGRNNLSEADGKQIIHNSRQLLQSIKTEIFPENYLKALKEVKLAKYYQWKDKILNAQRNFPNLETSDFSLFSDLNTPDYQQAKQLYKEGRAQYDSGNYQQAITKLETAIPLYKKNTSRHISLAEAQYQLGLAYQQIANHLKAKENINAGIKIFSDLKMDIYLEKAYENLAYSYIKNGETAGYEVQQRDLLQRAGTDREKLAAHLALAGLYKAIKENGLLLPPPTSIEDLIERESFHYSEAYKFTQGIVDDEAQVVFQREMGISQQLKLGTYNIQQCVVVIAHDPLTKKSVLTHFDRLSGPLTFINELLKEFPDTPKIDLYLTGGRDRSVSTEPDVIDGKIISDSNIDQVLKQIYRQQDRFNIKSTYLADPLLPAAVIFDPQSASLKAGMPNHPGTSLNARAARVGFSGPKQIILGYLEPLNRVDFSASELQRQLSLTTEQKQKLEITLKQELQLQFNKPLRSRMWSHNQIVYPAMMSIKDRVVQSAISPLLENFIELHNPMFGASLLQPQIPIFDFDQWLQQQQTSISHDLLDVLFPQQTISQLDFDNNDSFDDIDVGTDVDDDFAMPSAAKRMCFSNRKKRTADECLLSRDIIDSINTAEDKANTQTINIDSSLLLEAYKGMDDISRTELLKLAASSQISGSKQDIVRQLIRIERMKPHFKLMGGISSGLMQGMMAEATLAALLRGDANKTAAINLSLMGGGYFLGKFSEAAIIKGERLIAEGESLLGRSLKMSTPFLNRGTSILIAFDLVNQAKALANGTADALVGVVGDSLMLGSDLITAGIEMAEFAGFEALAGISNVAGPIGQIVSGIIMLGMQIFAAVQSVARLDTLVHLTGWEKFKEGWRGFFNIPPEEYIQKKADLIDFYNHLFKQKKLTFLKNHTEILYHIFSAFEQTSQECRIIEKDKGPLDYVGDWKAGTVRPKKTVKLCHPIFEEYKYSSVNFQEKQVAYKSTAVVPSNPEPSAIRFICLPTGEGDSASLSDFSDDGKAFRCENAFGLANSHATGNLAYFNLGEGHARAIGFPDNPNLFTIKKGFMYFTGGKQNDLFILQAGSIRGILNGGEGEDTLDLSAFSPSERPIIDLSTRQIEGRENSITIRNVENIIGKRLFAESFIADCNTRILNTQGGTRSDKDQISIPPAAHCDYALKMPLHPNTIVDNKATQGNFSYIIFPEAGETQVNLPAIGEAIHQFMFNCRVENLESISFQAKQQADNIPLQHTVHFNFANFVFKVNAIRSKTSVFYFQDGAELKLGDKQNTYIFYNNIESNIDTIIDKYSSIANALNMTFFFSTEENKLLIIGHGKHEVMQNDPSAYETHLVGNGGENLFVMNYGRASNVVLYQRSDNDFIDTLDLRSITRQFSAPIRIIFPNSNNHLGNDVLLTLGIPEMSIRLKNATLNDWHKQLHIITDIAPQKIVGSPPYLRLEPIPLEFGQQPGIVIQAGDVEAGTKIIIPRDFDQHVFFRDGAHVRLTNNLNLFPKTQPNTILFANYFKEPKLSTLSIQFSDNLTLSLSDKQTEINMAPDFESQWLKREKLLNSLVFASMEQQNHTYENINRIEIFSTQNSSNFSFNETEKNDPAHRDINEVFRRRRSIPNTTIDTKTELMSYQAKKSEAIVISIPISSLMSGLISGVCHEVSERNKQQYPK